VIDLLDEARELHAQLQQTERGTILHDELRLRRNRRLRWLYRDDPERWSTRRLAEEIGATQATIYTATRG
jgi:hypothetical protein